MVFCNKLWSIASKYPQKRHNPYFNRWFSAIKVLGKNKKGVICHNPYFNRWFSAIYFNGKNTDKLFMSQSLF